MWQVLLIKYTHIYYISNIEQWFYYELFVPPEAISMDDAVPPTNSLKQPVNFEPKFATTKTENSSFAALTNNLLTLYLYK